ncbi:MAG: hypothetical protein DWQ36_16210 [Acidobacteria bacterium]|nr:MAG: hypothetical protein DWQ30_10000 [Acidobacteriota bacterium]REK05397.1 MAG: hypothetical protein DWQ36_16210 [Acidobacteriota bacterium]
MSSPHPSARRVRPRLAPLASVVVATGALSAAALSWGSVTTSTSAAQAASQPRGEPGGGGAAGPRTSKRVRPVYLELPAGSTGPCAQRAPCPLIGLVDGKMVAAQMMRVPSRPWRLWWFQDGPVVRGTQISAISGAQGGGHQLAWSEEEPGRFVLQERERPILAHATEAAPVAGSWPSHRLYDPRGVAPVTSGRGFGLGIEGVATTLVPVVTRRRPLAGGPIAGGHLLDVDWRPAGTPTGEVAFTELRQVRVFVLDDGGYLLQTDSLFLPPVQPEGAKARRRSEGTARLVWRVDLPDRGAEAVSTLEDPVPLLPLPARDAASSTTPASSAGARPEEVAEWIGQRRSHDGRTLHVVLLADPLPSPRTLRSSGDALTIESPAPHLGARPVRSSVRVWIVEGAIERHDIEAQVDAYAGRSVEPTAEELARRGQTADRPW